MFVPQSLIQTHNNEHVVGSPGENSVSIVCISPTRDIMVWLDVIVEILRIERRFDLPSGQLFHSSCVESNRHDTESDALRDQE